MPANISKQRRRQVLATYPTCVYCGVEYHPQRTERQPTVDHITPISQGGTHDPTNLVGCCRACNAAKRDRTPQQWAADILAAAASWEASLAPDPQYAGLMCDAMADG